MQRWREQENPKPAEQRDILLAMEILLNWACLESQEGRIEKAVELLTLVKRVSPHPEEIDKRIAEVRAGQVLQPPDK